MEHSVIVKDTGDYLGLITPSKPAEHTYSPHPAYSRLFTIMCFPVFPPLSV